MSDAIDGEVLPAIKKEDKPLTYRQKRFIDLYAGNGTEAARGAGYEGTDMELSRYAHRLLKKANIRKALAERDAKERDVRVASRVERQEFWSATMRDPEQDMGVRLKASELLGKSQADFVDRVEQETTIVVEVRSYREE